MSDVYNPETQLFERLEALELEARQLATKRAALPAGEQFDVLTQQLREIEERIESLKRRLKPS